jgi:hypothetical protein
VPPRRPDCLWVEPDGKRLSEATSSVPNMGLPTGNELTSIFTLGVVVELTNAAGGDAVSHTAVLESSRAGVEARQLREDLLALAARGLVELDERFNGVWLARPTSSGRLVWAEIETSRNSARDRRRRMRDEYLIWLYDQDADGLSPTSDEYLSAGGSYLGRAYDQDDLERTGQWLLESGFIKGPLVWQRPDPIRPQITAKGRLYVEEERSVHESPKSVGSTNFHNTINGPAVLAQNSQHVTQTQNVKGWEDNARSFSAAVNQLAQVLVDSELKETAEALRAELDGAARPSRARDLVDNIMKALGSGAGGALGGVLATQGVAVLGSLPL